MLISLIRLVYQLAYLSVGITDQNHLLQQLAIWSCFGNNLPENQQQFLDGVILKWQHKADYGHQKSWQLLTIQDHDYDLLQGFSLCLDLPLLCRNMIIFIITTMNRTIFTFTYWVVSPLTIIKNTVKLSVWRETFQKWISLLYTLCYGNWGNTLIVMQVTIKNTYLDLLWGWLQKGALSQKEHWWECNKRSLQLSFCCWCYMCL